MITTLTLTRKRCIVPFTPAKSLLTGTYFAVTFLRHAVRWTLQTLGQISGTNLIQNQVSVLRTNYNKYEHASMVNPLRLMEQIFKDARQKDTALLLLLTVL